MSRGRAQLRNSQIRDSRIQGPTNVYFRATGGTISGTLTVNGPIAFASARIIAGNGVPEGSITANVASLFLREDGSGTYSLYLKKTGVGNTGWVPVL